MGFVKVVKNKAYFKRFQVKYRRRREGKTDYYARKRLITQDKNKYNTPKYRIVVRFSNTDVTCQIVAAKVIGDVTLTAAYSRELPRYGLKYGLTNYAAAYATGLLCARRHLAKLGLADKYVGQKVANGEDFTVEPVEGSPRPFCALLDTGLLRTTTGHRVFAAMKGALDGGIDVPHSESRFVGYSKEDKKLDAATLRKYIFGGHIADYMNHLASESPDKYKKLFSRYVKDGIKGTDLENLYKKAHAAIRADPSAKKVSKPAAAAGAKPRRKTLRSKLSLEQRKDKIRQKIAAHKAAAETEA